MGGLKGFPAPSVKELFLGSFGARLGVFIPHTGEPVTSWNYCGRCEDLELRNLQGKICQENYQISNPKLICEIFSGAE